VPDFADFADFFFVAMGASSQWSKHHHAHVSCPRRRIRGEA
jgi:hypothetical protein